MAEVLLADRLEEKGKKIDLIMAHHPEGKAMAGRYDVMVIKKICWHNWVCLSMRQVRVLQGGLRKVH